MSALATAAAECIYAPDLAPYQTALPEDFAIGATRSDRLGRVVAPVSVNGQGPFRFIVDTGANRSVLSQGLVERLGLTPEGQGERARAQTDKKRFLALPAPGFEGGL